MPVSNLEGGIPRLSTPTTSSWKQRVYAAYVSSGQVRDTGEPVETLFRSGGGYIRRLIAKHMPQDRTIRIVDLGCGHGIFLYFLKRAGYQQISGIDFSSEQIAMAHRLGIWEAKQERIDVFLGTADDCSVDVILLIDVLEHLTRGELFGILDGVVRVLRPGGKCIAHVPNAAGLYGMAVRYGDVTHEQAFTEISAKQVFHTIGFRQVACYEDKPVVQGLKGLARRILWEIGTLPYRILISAEVGGRGFILSPNMLVIARKGSYEKSESQPQCPWGMIDA